MLTLRQPKVKAELFWVSKAFISRMMPSSNKSIQPSSITIPADPKASITISDMSIKGHPECYRLLPLFNIRLIILLLHSIPMINLILPTTISHSGIWKAQIPKITQFLKFW